MQHAALQPKPCRPPPRQEGPPRRRAQRLHVVPVHTHAIGGQSVPRGGADVLGAPEDVGEAQVIHQHHHEVGGWGAHWGPAPCAAAAAAENREQREQVPNLHRRRAGGDRRAEGGEQQEQVGDPNRAVVVDV